MIKYIKSVLWRVAKRLSYIDEARCLKVKATKLRLLVPTKLLPTDHIIKLPWEMSQLPVQPLTVYTAVKCTSVPFQILWKGINLSATRSVQFLCLSLGCLKLFGCHSQLHGCSTMYMASSGNREMSELWLLSVLHCVRRRSLPSNHTQCNVNDAAI